MPIYKSIGRSRKIQAQFSQTWTFFFVELCKLQLKRLVDRLLCPQIWCNFQKISCKKPLLTARLSPNPKMTVRLQIQIGHLRDGRKRGSGGEGETFILLHHMSPHSHSFSADWKGPPTPADRPHCFLNGRDSKLVPYLANRVAFMES